MQIELVKIGSPYKQGNATKIDIEYIRDGKNVKRSLFGYGKTREVIQGLAAFKENDIADVELEKAEKDGQTYYNWVGIKKVEGPAATAAKKSEYKSTYETPEERAEKNVRIGRMAALNSAIEYGKHRDLKELFNNAEHMVGFIFQTDVAAGMARATTLAEKGQKAANPDAVEDDFPFDK